MSSRRGPLSAGKRLAQHGGDLLGLVDGERGLHGVGDPVRIRRPRPVAASATSPTTITFVRRLADRALDLLVVGVADQEHRVARPA